MRRQNYFFNKLVTETNLNSLQDYIENSDQDRVKEALGSGVAIGLTGIPGGGLTVKIEPGAAYDSLGRRIVVEEETLIDVSLDYLGASTEPSSTSVARFLTIFVYYTNIETTPLLDGRGALIFGRNLESFTVRVVQTEDISVDSILEDINFPDDPDINGIACFNVLRLFGINEITTNHIDLFDRDVAITSIEAFDDHVRSIDFPHPDGSVTPNKLEFDYLQSSGGSFRDDLSMDSFELRNVQDASTPYEVVNKRTVDRAIAGLSDNVKQLFRFADRKGTISLDTEQLNSSVKSTILSNNSYDSGNVEIVTLPAEDIYQVQFSATVRAVHVPLSLKKIDKAFFGLDAGTESKGSTNHKKVIRSSYDYELDSLNVFGAPFVLKRNYVFKGSTLYFRMFYTARVLAETYNYVKFNPSLKLDINYTISIRRKGIIQ